MRSLPQSSIDLGQCCIIVEVRDYRFVPRLQKQDAEWTKAGRDAEHLRHVVIPKAEVTVCA